ncbi:UBP-type zinc finger domain-containing protein [Actinophytocola sediminis]
MAQCAHLDQVRDVSPSTTEGCTDCLATGGQWVHLRECLTCGHVGCCDSSPSRHASAHFAHTDHAVMRSFERGEDWRWCFVDQTIV